MCLGRKGRTMCWGYLGGWRDHWMEDQVVLESHCLCSEVITEPRRVAAESVVPLQGRTCTVASQSPNKVDKAHSGGPGAGSRAGWEALLPELKSVPSFLNNGPGLSHALLHPLHPGCRTSHGVSGPSELDARELGGGRRAARTRARPAWKAPSQRNGAIPLGRGSWPGPAAPASPGP